MKKCSWCGKEYPDDVLICAIDQSPLEPGVAVPAPVSGKADRLLKRFSEAGIPFRVERIERRKRSGATSYRTEGFIEIYVRPEDHARADQIVTEDWKV